MSNLYTLYEEDSSTITQNLDMKKFAIHNLKTYPENNADATSKKYVDDENLKLLDLAATRQLLGDLDLNDNSIVGIHDINATNSAVSKKYIDDQLATKISFIAGNNVLEHYTFLRGLSFSSQRLKNVGFPTQNQDATSKIYVDRELAKKLSLTGGTLSGNLNMNSQKITFLASPTHANDATSMTYVDTQIYLARSTLLPLDGSGTMTGKIDMGGHPVSKLATPLQTTDATTKLYVDDKFNASFLKAGGTITGNTTVDAHLAVNAILLRGSFYKNSWTYAQMYIANPLDTRFRWVLGHRADTNPPTRTNMILKFCIQGPGQSLATKGYLEASRSSTRMNFTGQHRCFCQTTKKIEPGLILEATGVYKNMDQDLPVDQPTLNESLPIVQVCDTEKSKKVFGVYSELEVKREFSAGNFVSVYDKDVGDERVFVNSVGEGAILVCDANGELENGDYITSFRQGYGQKQDDDILHNYTVAKITQDTNFKSSRKTKTMHGKKYKVLLVGCTYHCG